MCSNGHFTDYSRILVKEGFGDDYLIYYSRILVKEGIDTGSLEPYREETNRKCCYCFKIFSISKNFKLNDKNCDECQKIRSKFSSNDSGKMFVLWNDNALYRVFTNLCLNWADRILRTERYLERYGNIKMEKKIA